MADAETNVPNHEAEGSNFRKLRCRTVATGRLGHRTYIRELPPLGAEAANTSSLTDETSLPMAHVAGKWPRSRGAGTHTLTGPRLHP